MDLSYKNEQQQSSAGSPPGEADKSSPDWIAEVSHELRLPIANLKLLIETLLDGAAQDPDARERMLSRARMEVERLQHLVVSLLSAEQVTSARTELPRQWLVLEEKARYAVESTRHMSAAKGLTVNIEIEPGWSIYANPEQFEQVLLNLLENAIKFTPPSGQIWIKSGNIPGGLLVSDNGIGIASQEIPKIFKRFYRIDRAQSRGSTGLGLSIVKHIADLHGAKINVISEEGRGSEFHLEFPGPQI